MYENDFEPAVEIDQNLTVLTESGWQHFVLRYAEPMPSETPMIKDFGALAKDGTVTEQEIDMLEMKDNELGQFRFEVLDDILIKVAQPSAAARHSIKNTRAQVGMMTKVKDPELKSTEFFVFENNNVYFEEVKARAALAKTRVLFFGYRLVLKNWLNVATANRNNLLTLIESVEKREPIEDKKPRYPDKLVDQLRRNLVDAEMELLLGKPKRTTYVVATAKTGAD